MAGARHICNLIESSKYDLIGVGHGRTLAAAIDLLPNISAQGVRFVSLLGGLTRRFAASPFDVIHRLADRTGAEAYIMPVPFFANTVKDKKVFETQIGVSDVIQMARRAQLYIAGIGEVDPQSFIATGGMIDEDDISALRSAGAAGEVLGQFFTADGAHIPNAISDRALAPSIEELKQHRIVALAGGAAKTQAIRAILASGLLFGLITDEATARRLAHDESGREPGKKTGESASG
jgi:DNA-binding transcriptional regulator LsrR (DeoR family)